MTDAFVFIWYVLSISGADCNACI